MKRGKDLIKLREGVWIDKMNIIKRLQSMGLKPPRSRKKIWKWKFWK